MVRGPPKNLAAVAAASALLIAAAPVHGALRAGAAAVDITPERLPVLVNGGMLSKSADRVKTRLHARALCLHDGETEVAIVVVDTCMMPRELIDEAKALAAGRTGIPPNRQLMAATHTHSAPSCMGALGTAADPAYVPFLRARLADAVAAAQANLEPARAGIAVAQAPEHTALRRWVRRPDRLGEDPFGNRTVRANMHAAGNWDDVTGESGPEDPDLSVISVQAASGRPLAVLANFSMHYFSDQPLSADYFGLFAEGLRERLAPGDDPAGAPPFVAMMSHGCSGDIWRRDYRKPPGERGEDVTIGQYSRELVDIAAGALAGVEHRPDLTLAMAERRLPLRYRLPDQQRLAWARAITAEMGERPPEDRTEVYAREQVLLHELGSTEVVVQALRIGSFALATTPTETYALTGLKIKRQSPLQPTVVLDLANGGDGYIPPPEQHLLGGYNTWAARSAGLEVGAEPAITEAALALLEAVAGKPRRPYRQTDGPAAREILALSPAAYWRLDEFGGRRALDRGDGRRDGFFEDGVVFFLEGPRPAAFNGPDTAEPNRAPHFCGGRLVARVPLANGGAGVGAEGNGAYSVALWFWNGMPDGAREVAGWLFSRDRDHATGPGGDHLGLDGAGRLIFLSGHGTLNSGTRRVPRWTWTHAALVRDGSRARVYLDGAPEIEVEVKTDTAARDRLSTIDQLFIGGRSDRSDNWEGRIDEVALFPRALTPEEVGRLWVPPGR